MSANRWIVVTAAALAACNSRSDAASALTAVASQGTAVRPAAAAAPAPALQLTGAALAAALAVVRAEAARQEMTDVTVTTAQSLTVMQSKTAFATLVTGRGNLPGSRSPGCFVATVVGEGVMLIPTLGYGDYELETCGGPLAVGILASGPMSRIGVLFRSYSREALETVPIVVGWDLADNTLLIDQAASRRALDGGATTIAKLRGLAR